MKVTVHATMQKAPFNVSVSRIPSQDRHITILDIRQPDESINDGVTFILRDPAQLRDLIMALVDGCEKVQAEERADADAVLKAKVHAVLDAQCALRAREQAERTRKVLAGEPDPLEEMYRAAAAEAR